MILSISSRYDACMCTVHSRPRWDGVQLRPRQQRIRTWRGVVVLIDALGLSSVLPNIWLNPSRRPLHCIWADATAAVHISATDGNWSRQPSFRSEPSLSEGRGIHWRAMTLFRHYTIRFLIELVWKLPLTLFRWDSPREFYWTVKWESCNILSSGVLGRETNYVSLTSMSVYI